jgi:hypothetical protein
MQVNGKQLSVKTLRQTGRQIFTVCAALAGTALATTGAQAITVTSAQLGTVAENSASANFDVLTIAELDGTSSLRGSELFGFEGLWVGSDDTPGRYSLTFSVPVVSLTFQFIALTALSGNGAETLSNFVTDSATSRSFSSMDSSASWNGSTITPLEEDSRGMLTFTSVGGFLNLTFDHLQPNAFSGFIVNQIDYTTAAPIPEPSTTALLAAGVLGLSLRVARAKQRRLQQRP